MLKTDFKWQLINDSITDSDKKALTDFINMPNQKFTNGVKVREFEAEWCKWSGAKYSTFVNSGSSANLLIFQCLINPLVKKLKRGDEVLISSICWSTSLWPIIQSGLNVKFVDTDLRNLNIDLDDLKNKITKKSCMMSSV